MDAIPYASSMFFYYSAHNERVEKLRRDELAAVNSPDSARQHIAKVQARLKKIFGPFPAIPPLQPVITGTVEKNGVLVDKVYFQSRPGHFVTGLFLRAVGSGSDLPGVLGVCGHAEIGKGQDKYQLFSFGLARKGFAVFLVDPVGQGEMLQFRSNNPGYPDYVKGATHQHNQLGKQLLLNDELLCNYYVHDARCAIDYLLSRPEVRPGKVAVTGNSGGGQMSYYLFGLDDRIEIAAPSCHMNKLAWIFKDEIATDAESSPPGLRGCLGDRPDFLIAGAPKPCLLIGQKRDFVDLRGLQESYAEAQRIYRALGQEENLQLYLGPGVHGYHLDGREAMYGFFTKYYFGQADPVEPPLELLTAEEYTVTPTGMAIDLPGAKSISAMLYEKLPPSPRPNSGPAFAALLRDKLQLQTLQPPVPEYRTLRPVWRGEGKTLCMYAIVSEPGTTAVPVLHCITPASEPLLPEGSRASLYLAHLDAEQELLAMEDCQSVFALDVRGIGKSASLNGKPNSDYLEPFGREYFIEVTAKFLGDSFLGGKIRDVLATLALLHNAGYHDLTLHGRGLGGLLAAYAAALTPLPVSKIILQNTPRSFLELLQRNFIACPQSYLVPGFLTVGDLPDLYQYLQQNYTLEIIDPVLDIQY
jgi:hypothetical protein